MATFEADQAKIARAKVMALLAAAVIAAVFLAVAIYGPVQQRRLDNPEGAVIMQIVGFAFVVGWAERRSRRLNCAPANW